MLGSSSRLLDSKLGDVVHKRTTGDIGIETELEGTLVEPEGPYWTHKKEGSLRQHPHGYEYILVRPVAFEALHKVMPDLEAVFKKSKLFPSIRCSTHIHVNVLRKTYREIYNILGFYYLIEDLLVKTQGEMRCGNCFCLRMSDAEGVAYDLLESVKQGTFLAQFQMNANKYGAVNLAAPIKYGSLEFRFFRPLTDTTLLQEWCAILYHLVHKASEIPLPEILKRAKHWPVEDFLKSVFSEKEVSFILGSTSAYEAQHMLMGNFEHIQNLSNALYGKRKFSIPKIFLETDLEAANTNASAPFFNWINEPTSINPFTSIANPEIPPAPTASPILNIEEQEEGELE